MTNLYPLRFQPLFRQYLWGGRRLGTELHKPIGDEGVYAESWEIVDHGDDQSVVANGPLANRTLQELIQRDAVGLLGDRVAAAIRSEALPGNLRNRFPLLLKILDANRDLSVQVHPNDAQGSCLDPPDLGKTEAWLVMDVAPGSKIYAGLKSGVDRAAFVVAVADNRVEETLYSFEPAPGDCVFIPAGTLHAIGAGLLVAEIQQASDTTFRVYDWGRVDADGHPRTLHIEQAIDVIDFHTGPVHPIRTTRTPTDADSVSLVQCDKFKLQTYSLREPRKISTEGGFLIMAVLSGAVHVNGDPQTVPLRRGDTLLIPACLETAEMIPDETAQIMIASP